MDRRKERMKLLSKFERLLTDSGLPPQVIDRSPKMLRRRLATFLAKSENRDGRGVKVRVSEDVNRTLRHLCRAVVCADGRRDPEGRYQAARGNAKRLVRMVQSAPFEQIQAEASRFVGAVNKAGHHANERLKRQQAQDARVELDEHWALRPILSCDQLERVGKRLSLCVGNRRAWAGSSYFDELREGSTEFYLLEKEAHPFGLIKVEEGDARTAEETSAKDNEDLVLTRKLALKVLKALDATADEEYCFTSVGAFSPFIQGKRSADAELTCAKRRYNLWWFPKERALIVKRKGRKAWSMFKRERSSGHTLPTWEQVGYGDAVEAGQLPALLVLIERRYPELSERISPAMRPPKPRPSKASKSRPSPTSATTPSTTEVHSSAALTPRARLALRRLRRHFLQNAPNPADTSTPNGAEPEVGSSPREADLNGRSETSTPSVADPKSA